MFLNTIDTETAEPVDDCPIRKSLALLAAGLDTQFLRAGTTLAAAVAVIDRLIGGLDDIVAALDERTAGAAVADLRRVANELATLPERQVARAGRMSGVAAIARTLDDHVLDMHETLRILSIYGMNIKIAASGEDQFVGFVEGMSVKLGVGEQQLAGFMAQLKALMASVASVQQADRLLAAERDRVDPEIPTRLARDAAALSAHLVGVATLARRVASIARSVQGKVAVVLGALQVGDSTRQRLEHVVSTLQLVEAHAVDRPSDPAVVGHIDRLLAAQIEATILDFVRDTTAMLTSLADLGPDTVNLQKLVAEQGDDGGRDFLTRLEQGITDVDRITTRLRDADHRSRTMVAIITDTVADLSARLVSVQGIRVNVQDIATNMRLLCRRHGTTGRAVSVIAKEVDHYASRLGCVTGNVALAIDDLGGIQASLRTDVGTGTDPADGENGGRDMGDTLTSALAVIREACQRTEHVTTEGGDDARQLTDMLVDIGVELKRELAVADVMQAAADTLACRTPPVPLTEESAATLALLLPEIGRFYTMVQERVVHADFLLPGMETVAAEIADADDDDDGLF